MKDMMLLDMMRRACDAFLVCVEMESDQVDNQTTFVFVF